jgi:NAD(P)-dependent dehydrogenase (short-subunit alcohol dehydrogenase family)
MMELDKSIIVTGGSLGIGRACAERFAKAGGRVLIVAPISRSMPASCQSLASSCRVTVSGASL